MMRCIVCGDNAYRCRKGRCEKCYWKKYREENKEKIAKHQKKYREENKEKIAEDKKKYREENKEKIAEDSKKYREDNKEKIAEDKKKYREDNKEKIAEDSKKYREENKENIAKHKKKCREEKYGRRMETNRECSMFLGVHIAERVLSNIFNDVRRMPINNHGYDFICNKGKKIDVKSSTMRYNKNKKNRWGFAIKKNTMADFFLCLAFDDRENLNPLHIWLLPNDLVNQQVGASISNNTIHKWDEYRLEIDEIIECCDTMKATTPKPYTP